MTKAHRANIECSALPQEVQARGHDIMSGAIIYPAYRPDCDFAVIFVEVSGCLPMCGAGTIGLVSAVIEEGLVTPRVPGRLSIEAPAGKVDIEYEKPGEFVESVRMFNVASYLHAADIEVDVPGLGHLVVDIAETITQWLSRRTHGPVSPAYRAQKSST